MHSNTSYNMNDTHSCNKEVSECAQMKLIPKRNSPHTGIMLTTRVRCRMSVCLPLPCDFPVSPPRERINFSVAEYEHLRPCVRNDKVLTVSILNAIPKMQIPRVWGPPSSWEVGVPRGGNFRCSCQQQGWLSWHVNENVLGSLEIQPCRCTDL